VREINVSHTGDPVHAGDKALTWETPVQRGRVNRYAVIFLAFALLYFFLLLLFFFFLYIQKMVFYV
jgi:hypothetical protein